MLDFSWAELLIILAVAVFVIGPKDIPNMMYGLGRIVKRFQYIKFAISQQFDEVMQSHDIEELRRGVNIEAPPMEAHGHDPKGGHDIVDITTLYQRIAEPYALAFQEPSDHIDSFIELLPKGAKVLDVGCGNGMDAFYLEEKGFAVKAFDLSEEMLEYAKARESKVDFEKADLKDFEYGTEEYDGIIASYSLIHLFKEDVPRVLSKIYEGLKPGGSFFVGVQSGKPAELYVDEPMAAHTRFFLNVFGKEELEKNLEDAGFEFIKSFERPSQSEDELAYTKLCVMARK